MSGNFLTLFRRNGTAMWWWRNVVTWSQWAHCISKPDIIVILKIGKESWIVLREETITWCTDLDSSYKIIRDRKTFIYRKHSSLFSASENHSVRNSLKMKNVGRPLVTPQTLLNMEEFILEQTARTPRWRQSSPEEGAPGCQIRGAATLDTNPGFHP